MRKWSWFSSIKSIANIPYVPKCSAFKFKLIDFIWNIRKRVNQLSRNQMLLLKWCGQKKHPNLHKNIERKKKKRIRFSGSMTHLSTYGSLGGFEIKLFTLREAKFWGKKGEFFPTIICPTNLQIKTHAIEMVQFLVK